MKIIRRKSDNRVLFTSYISLTASGVYGGHWYDSRATTDTAEEIEVESLPRGFFPGGWSYTEGVWTKVDADN